MITLICLRRAGDPGPPAGLEAAAGAPVQLVEAGPLGAWICSGELGRDLEGVRAHDAVVRTALRSASPLPVRFGTAFAEAGSLLAMLADHEAEFVEALDRIEGKVEMGIRLSWVEPASPAERERTRASEPASGRAYLEARRRDLAAQEEHRARAAALVERLESRLAPEGMPSVHQLVPEPGVAALVAHLVQRQGVAEYRARVEAARAHCPEVVLHLTGPWAPYSFV